MARSTMFGPEAPVVYGPEKPPPKKPGPRPVMHGPEKPPKPKTFGPEEAPPPPKPKTFGPEEAPPVGYGSSERTPKAANRSDAPPRDEYAAQMLRLRRLAEKDENENENAPPPPNDYSLARQREKDDEDIKWLRGLPGARGLPAAAAMGFQKATEVYMEPAIQAETDRVMRRFGTAGNVVGMGGLGVQSMSSSRGADRGALAAAAVDAGLTISQALLAARAGRAKEAAGMFALGLADMVGPVAVAGPRTRRGTSAHFGQQARTAGALGYDIGVTALQEKLQNYAEETGNKQFSQELKALAADPERLKETIQKK